MKNSRRRILVLMSETGGGHRSAAEVIAAALERQYPDCYQVDIVDGLVSAAFFPFNRIDRIYFLAVTYTRTIYGELFHFTNQPKVYPLALSMIETLIVRGLKRLLLSHSPDLVVSVHPFLTTVPYRALRELGSRTPFIVVVTDLFDTHKLWFEPGADLYLVPTTKAKAEALGAGIVPEKIRVVGLPVDLAFSDESKHAMSKPAWRSKLGLDPDRTTVLIVGGGQGMGRMYEIVRSIARARLPVQIVAIAGRNESLRKRLLAKRWKIRVNVQGFVRNMPDWMRASDVIITKAGPATIFEAAACGLPILLSGNLPGQEEGNVEFVEQEGLGVLREKPSGIVQTLREWLDPGNDTMARMAANARRVARPNAADEIAHAVNSLQARETSTMS